MKVKLSITEIWTIQHALELLPPTNQSRDIQQKLRQAELKLDEKRVQVSRGMPFYGLDSAKQAARYAALTGSCDWGHLPGCRHRNRGRLDLHELRAAQAYAESKGAPHECSGFTCTPECGPAMDVPDEAFDE